MATGISIIDAGAMMLQVFKNFHRIRQGAPCCLTLSLYTVAANCARGQIYYLQLPCFWREKAVSALSEIERYQSMPNLHDDASKHLANVVFMFIILLGRGVGIKLALIVIYTVS